MLKEEFKNNPERYPEFERDLLKMALPSMSFFLLIFFVYDYLTSSGNIWSVSHFLPYTFIVVAMVIAVVFKFKKQKSQYLSYKLSINESDLIREQDGLPMLVIPKNEVREIIKNTSKSYTIKGQSYHNVIGIYAQIENKEHLESLLNSITPIKVLSQKPFLEKYKLLTIPVSMILFYSVFYSTNKFIVAVGGITLLGLLGYSGYILTTNKNLNKKIKWGLFAFIPVICSIIYNIYMKVFV